MALYETDVPKGVGGLVVSMVVVPSCATVTDVVADDAKKLGSPPYDAVTLSVPAGAVVTMHEVLPLTKGTAHSVTEPVVKVTVPVGVPPDEVTLAE